MTTSVESEITEIDKKRWSVRYGVIVGLGVIFGVKLYLVLFVIDFFVGLYSFITSLVLFIVLFCSYVRFRDPYLEAKKHSRLQNKLSVSVIIPVKNEESYIADCIYSCVNSTYPLKEVIVVNDGSTDRTGSILSELQVRWPSLRVIHLPENLGKKHAIERASQIAQGDIYVFMDSDCVMQQDAIARMVDIFESDVQVGAVTAHGRVKEANNSSLLQKVQDVWYDGQFRIIKGMESSFSSITCCSGALSAYRRIAIHAHLKAWANDRFLGRPFKFCTDRMLTYYVLRAPVVVTAEPGWLANNYDQEIGDQVSALSTVRHSDSYPDLESEFSFEKTPRALWKVLYSPSVKVYIGAPRTMRQLILQQIRWRKSFLRSIFATGSIYWKRPRGAATLYYFQVGLKIIRPLVVLKAMILLPLTGDWTTAIFYMSSVLFSGMLYGIDFRLRNPGDKKWLLRPIMTLLSTLVLSWLLVIAIATIRRQKWR